MAIERRRGCGFRKLGGLYLVADGPGVTCGRLPAPLHQCPACGASIKPARGWTWVQPGPLLAQLPPCERAPGCGDCPLRTAEALGEWAGLVWVGERYYPTPAHFDMEARQLGISRRVPAVPRGFVVGQHWVLLAHPKGAPAVAAETTEPAMGPGVCWVFKPQRLEQLITEEAAQDADYCDGLKKRGITPVVVPADDPDHQ